jgi:hypothetical protein
MTFSDFCSPDMNMARSAVQQCEIVSESAQKRACVARLEVAQHVMSRVGFCTRFWRALCCCCAGKQDDGDDASVMPVDFGTLLAPAGGSGSAASEDVPAAASCCKTCLTTILSAHYAQTFVTHPGMRFGDRDKSFIGVMRVMSALGSQWFFLTIFALYQASIMKMKN